jgi:GATA-binding protein
LPDLDATRASPAWLVIRYNRLLCVGRSLSPFPLRVCSMPSILNLKFKVRARPLSPSPPHFSQGNKSFVAFSNLNDAESLTQTWKVRIPIHLSLASNPPHQVCTKVASFLEQGQRLENLSWRLWHLQNLIVDTDNAKSRREFRKLSKCMGDKLDKEKGR